MTLFLITLSVILFLGLGVLAFSYFMRKRILPAGEVAYSDTVQSSGEVLTSQKIPLVGKPDYVLKRNSDFIPVEVKTGKTPETPYKNHIAQLFAYCLLVEEHFGKRPPYGILRYPEKEFPLEFTAQAEAGVKHAVQEMIRKKQSATYREHMQTVCKLCREGKHDNSLELRA